MEILRIRALLFLLAGVFIWAPDFRTLPKALLDTELGFPYKVLKLLMEDPRQVSKVVPSKRASVPLKGVEVLLS